MTKSSCMGFAINIKVIFLVLTSTILSLAFIALTYSGHLFSFNQMLNGNQSNSTEKSQVEIKKQTYFQEVRRGTNIQAGDLEIHITTAIHYDNFPAMGGFNLFLNGWAREKTNTEFRCCLLSSNQSAVVDVKAFTYHIYSQWIVDMQNGEFSCSLSKDQFASYGIKEDFTYVTFARNSCVDAPRSILRIDYPTVVKDSLGICLKISYGDLNPELIVEWFEYVRLLGVTRVFTFLAKDLSEEARKVFMYYSSTGFLDTKPIHPATSKKGPERGFRQPRYDQQAWVDEVMACNDCKHTMSGLDYVIVKDLDELIIPTSANGTYLSILKETSKRFPKAGTFSFNSHVVPLNWKESRQSPLHIMSKISRTTFFNYDGADRNTRWAFKPHRTFFAQNNRAWEKKPFTHVQVPQELYRLIHRRKCKKSWNKCITTKDKVSDPLILKYERSLIDALKQLPLSRLLPNRTDYVNKVLAWAG